MRFNKIKIGRNQPCPCGSGKKFKRCCIDKSNSIPSPQDIKKAIEYFQSLPKEPFEKGGILTGRPFIETKFKGKYARAVGNRVFLRNQNETFQEFLLNHFRTLLGQKWFLNENKKDTEQQHILYRWFHELEKKFLENSQKAEDRTTNLRSIKIFGNIKSLLATAFDVYTLKHCADIPPRLLERLKLSEEFQGAKYEIAIAGIAARSGFKIDWQKKYCEFIGIHKISGEKIAFEAKSLHRRGVLGQKGNLDILDAKIKIEGRLRDALRWPSEDMPFIIFLDLNLPMTPSIKIEEKLWFQSLHNALKKSNVLNLERKNNFSALFITNFSWHFYEDIKVPQGEVLAILPLKSKNSLQDKKTFDLLNLACQQYGAVPARLEEEGRVINLTNYKIVDMLKMC